MSDSRSCCTPEACFAAKSGISADDDDFGLVGAVALVLGVVAGPPIPFLTPLVKAVSLRPCTTFQLQNSAEEAAGDTGVVPGRDQVGSSQTNSDRLRIGSRAGTANFREIGR